MIILEEEEEEPSSKLLLRRIYLPRCLFQAMIEHNRRYFWHRFESPWRQKTRIEFKVELFAKQFYLEIRDEF